MIPFQTLGFRFMGIAIGLPEIAFLILAPLATIHIMRSRQKFWTNGLNQYVFGWLLANIIAGWHSGIDSGVMTEIIKTTYLVFLYMLLKSTITPRMIQRTVKVITLSSLLAALTGIMGIALGYIGIETLLTIKRPHPYLIDVMQAKGFTPNPNMLASIIMIGILFQIHNIFSYRKLRTSNIFLLLILTIGFLITLSKTIVCLFIGIGLIWYFHNKQKLPRTFQTITKIIIAGLFTTYILGTHFIFIKKDQDYEPLKGDYVSGPILIETENFSIYP